MSQNLGTLVKPKIAGQWMFIPLKMVSIGIAPYPSKIGHEKILKNGFAHVRTMTIFYSLRLQPLMVPFVTPVVVKHVC